MTLKKRVFFLFILALLSVFIMAIIQIKLL